MMMCNNNIILYDDVVADDDDDEMRRGDFQHLPHQGRPCLLAAEQIATSRVRHIWLTRKRMVRCFSGWRKSMSYSMLTTTVAALLCCCITYADGKRSRGHTWPTMSFFPPCRIPPRAMVSVPSLVQTFSEPISMKYHHTNFPSEDEHADMNNAPISYGGILNLHQSINISGLEAQHVLEQVYNFFDEIDQAYSKPLKP